MLILIELPCYIQAGTTTATHLWLKTLPPGETNTLAGTAPAESRKEAAVMKDHEYKRGMLLMNGAKKHILLQDLIV